MQQLYVVDLECTAADPASEPVDALLRRHLLDGWSAAHDGAPTEADLTTAGFAVLPVREQPGLWHDLSWQVAEGGGVRALRVDLHEALRGDARLLTRTTITTSTDPGTGGVSTHLRVALGREVTSGRLAPALVPDLGRPALVGAVVTDPRLARTCDGQDVDGRLPVVRTAEQAADLVAAVREPARLPVLVVSPQDQGAWGLARRAASELVGLARVVVVASHEASDVLADQLPDLPVPRGGARLLWPALTRHHHPVYTPEQVAAQDPPLVPVLFRTLAAVSVVARGRDDGWTRARQAAQRSEAQQARERVDAARRSGDRAAELTALDEETGALRTEVEAWTAECQLLTDQVEALTVQSEALAALQYEVEHLRERCAALEAAAAPSALDWEDAPELDPRDAKPLFTFLERASGGACVFTANAAKVWRKSKFAFPDKMREVLVALARASSDYAAHRGDVEGRMAEWFRGGYHLELALTDTKLELSKRARFTYEGVDLEAVPHIKLGDAKQPRECGRVYFAWTADPSRFVVNHVGCHL